MRGDCVSRSMVDVAPLPDYSALVRGTPFLAQLLPARSLVVLPCCFADGLYASDTHETGFPM